MKFSTLNDFKETKNKFIFRYSPNKVRRETDSSIDSLGDQMQEILKKTNGDMNALRASMEGQKNLTVDTVKSGLSVRDKNGKIVGRLVDGEKVTFVSIAEKTTDSIGNETGETSVDRDHVWYKVKYLSKTYYDKRGRRKRRKKAVWRTGIVSSEYFEKKKLKIPAVATVTTQTGKGANTAPPNKDVTPARKDVDQDEAPEKPSVKNITIPGTVGLKIIQKLENKSGLTHFLVPGQSLNGLTLSADGTLTYTPNPADSGKSLTFTYKVKNSEGGVSDEGTITINVKKIDGSDSGKEVNPSNGAVNKPARLVQAPVVKVNSATSNVTPLLSNGMFGGLFTTEGRKSNKIDPLSRGIINLEDMQPEKMIISPQELEKLRQSISDPKISVSKQRDIQGLDLFKAYISARGTEEEQEWKFFGLNNPDKEEQQVMDDSLHMGTIAQEIRTLIKNIPTVTSIKDGIKILEDLYKGDNNKLKYISQFKSKYDKYMKQFDSSSLLTGDVNTFKNKPLSELQGRMDGIKLKMVQDLMDRKQFHQAGELLKSIFTRKKEFRKYINSQKVTDEEVKDIIESEEGLRDHLINNNVKDQIKKTIESQGEIKITERDRKGNITGEKIFKKGQHLNAFATLVTSNYNLTFAQAKSKIQLEKGLNEKDPLSEFSKYRLGSKEQEAIQKYQKIYGLQKGWDMGLKNRSWWKEQIIINVPLLIAGFGIGGIAAKAAFVAGRAAITRFGITSLAEGTLGRSALKVATGGVVGGQVANQVQHGMVEGHRDELFSPAAKNSMVMFGMMRALQPLLGTGVLGGMRGGPGLSNVLTKGSRMAGIKSSMVLQAQLASLSGIETAALTAADSIASGSNKNMTWERFFHTWSTVYILHNVGRGMSFAKAKKSSIPLVGKLRKKVLRKFKELQATQIKLKKFRGIYNDFKIEKTYLEAKASKTPLEISRLKTIKRRMSTFKNKYPKIDKTPISEMGWRPKIKVKDNAGISYEFKKGEKFTDSTGTQEFTVTRKTSDGKLEGVLRENGKVIDRKQIVPPDKLGSYASGNRVAPGIFARTGSRMKNALLNKIPFRNVRLSNKKYFDGTKAKVFETLEKGKSIKVKAGKTPQEFDIPSRLGGKITLSRTELKYQNHLGLTHTIAGGGSYKILVKGNEFKVSRNNSNGIITFERIK